VSVAGERRIVFLIGAVQFINILDFMIVMPLGPDFSRALGIPTSELGVIGGSYTLAAAVSGLVSSLFLERFDRRRALLIALTGLLAGTAAGGFATGLTSLIAARLFAGAFGGPATSLAFSIIADVVPPERRGRAMGAVMGAFSVASIAGVPIALELSLLGGFRMAFFAIAGLGALIAAGAFWTLPSLRGHLSAATRVGVRTLAALVTKPLVVLSYSMTAVTMAAGFIVIPNISAHVQLNLSYPRERIGTLYLVGGVVSLVSMRAVGWLVDRFGSFSVGSIGSVMLAAIVGLFFIVAPPGMPVIVVFTGFMMAMAFRNVAYNTLTSKVPAPNERAAFMSLQSSVQHLASATGALASARMLWEEGGKLRGVERIAAVSIGLTLALPFLLWLVERGVREKWGQAALSGGPKGGAGPIAGP
jgi:predicted MFS family arabinose efflux permease